MASWSLNPRVCPSATLQYNTYSTLPSWWRTVVDAGTLYCTNAHTSYRSSGHQRSRNIFDIICPILLLSGQYLRSVLKLGHTRMQQLDCSAIYKKYNFSTARNFFRGLPVTSTYCLSANRSQEADGLSPLRCHLLRVFLVDIVQYSTYRRMKDSL